MSFLARNSLRVLSRRSVPRYRGNATLSGLKAPTSAESPYIAELEAIEHHAADTTFLWRRISYYICAPAILVCSVWVYKLEAEHAEHEAHLKHENDGKLPQPPRFDYLNRRLKPFPWGPNSLFFNSITQRDMSAESD